MSVSVIHKLPRANYPAEHKLGGPYMMQTSRPSPYGHNHTHYATPAIVLVVSSSICPSGRPYTARAARHTERTCKTSSASPALPSKYVSPFASRWVPTHDTRCKRVHNGPGHVHQVARRQNITQHGAQTPQCRQRLLDYLRSQKTVFGKCEKEDVVVNDMEVESMLLSRPFLGSTSAHSLPKSSILSVRHCTATSPGDVTEFSRP